MKTLLKLAFIVLIVRPIIFVVLGLNIVGRDKLPLKGPALIVANHNSHLDTLVLLSLFPISILHKVRPIAAADYFLANKFISWVSIHLIGIIPLDRSGLASKDSLFKECFDALNNNEILLVFPEGSRGKPETIGKIKKGIYYLCKDKKEVPITPIVLRGLGRALPKGEALFVPFNCDVIIGEPVINSDNSKDFIENLTQTFNRLLSFCITKTHNEF